MIKDLGAGDSQSEPECDLEKTVNGVIDNLEKLKKDNFEKL